MPRGGGSELSRASSRGLEVRADAAAREFRDRLSWDSHEPTYLDGVWAICRVTHGSLVGILTLPRVDRIREFQTRAGRDAALVTLCLSKAFQ